MSQSKEIAQQFREVLLEGTWIATNFKAQLTQVTWEQATTKVGSLNTIAALAFHIDYYVGGLVQVFEGGSLDIRDKYSFDSPPIESQEDWERLLTKMWQNAERFATLVQQMPDEQLDQGFVDEKYGTYRKNIHAMIEHGFYHLGQVVLIRKLIGTGMKNETNG